MARSLNRSAVLKYEACPKGLHALRLLQLDTCWDTYTNQDMVSSTSAEADQAPAPSAGGIHSLQSSWRQSYLLHTDRNRPAALLLTPSDGVRAQPLPRVCRREHPRARALQALRAHCEGGWVGQLRPAIPPEPAPGSSHRETVNQRNRPPPAPAMGILAQMIPSIPGFHLEG